MNSSESEVAEVNFDGTCQGATLSQTLSTTGGMLIFGSMDAAMGDGSTTTPLAATPCWRAIERS